MITCTFGVLKATPKLYVCIIFKYNLVFLSPAKSESNLVTPLSHSPDCKFVPFKNSLKNNSGCFIKIVNPSIAGLREGGGKLFYESLLVLG